MIESSERYLTLARSIIREAQEECGLLHVHVVAKIRDSLVECRREAIQECAEVAANVANEEMPEPYWDSARARRMDWAWASGRIVTKICALAERPAPAEPSEIVQSDAPPEPSDAEVDAASNILWLKDGIITREIARVAGI